MKNHECLWFRPTKSRGLYGMTVNIDDILVKAIRPSTITGGREFSIKTYHFEHVLIFEGLQFEVSNE